MTFCLFSPSLFSFASFPSFCSERIEWLIILAQAIVWGEFLMLLSFLSQLKDIYLLKRLKEKSKIQDKERQKEVRY